MQKNPVNHFRNRIVDIDFNTRKAVNSAKAELIRTFEEVYQTPITAELNVEYDLNTDRLVIISNERLHITRELDFRCTGVEKIVRERNSAFFRINEPDVEYRYYFRMVGGA